ncbi:MAG TPA: enoyl-CoA hydratase/isomerase family protein [Terriglobales bacterium]|nr:enoyl-CoA hydratase/isomerase family protein [Terriglobales bacterium]
MPDFFSIETRDKVSILRLVSADGTNRLSRACVLALTKAVRELACTSPPSPLIITGNEKFFSAGADLSEIVLLSSDALAFAQMGQALTQLVDDFPAPVCAAIHGYCMGGGLDLVLACDYRIAAPNAEFGHRGAALGLITGWGGTQRLPRLIGRAKALQMFVAAEKLRAPQALAAGLVDAVAGDPLTEALRLCNRINGTKNPEGAPL